MRRDRWHVIRDGAEVTLTRRLPVRWDVEVTTELANAGRLRVAHQIRQDLWRALQRMRGFSPIVSVCRFDEKLKIRAGGRVESSFNRKETEAQIEELLSKPENRARWLRFGCNRGQLGTTAIADERFLQAEGAAL